MTTTFFLPPLWRAAVRRVPPMIGVLVVGAGPWLATRNAYGPVFSLQAVVEVVVPLAITVVAAQNAQGIAILQPGGHRPARAPTVAGSQIPR